MAPATHPWPGGVSWHYDVAAMPYIGWLFTRAISLPAGMVRLKGGVDSVFTPNSPPVGYSEDSAVSLVLRPHQFRANGRILRAEDGVGNAVRTIVTSLERR